MTLENLVISALDAEIEQYENSLTALPEPDFSLKHKKAIDEAIRIFNSNSRISVKPRTHGRHMNGRHILLVALVAVLIMATSVIAIAAVHPEYYMVVKERIREWTVTFTADGKSQGMTEFCISKGRMPKGFELESETSDNGLYAATYSSENGVEIIYVQEKLSESEVVGLDAENDYKKIEKINGITTVVMKKDNCYTMFWIHNGCSYTLVSNCDLSILKEYAKSIK